MKKRTTASRSATPDKVSNPRGSAPLLDAIFEPFPNGGGWSVVTARGDRQRAAYSSNTAKRDKAVADLKETACRLKLFVWGTYESQNSVLHFSHADPGCKSSGQPLTARAGKLARGQFKCGCNRRYAGSLRALSIEVPKAIAADRRGRLLSPQYFNNRGDLVWECEDGHEFSMSLESVKRGRWCPRCRDSMANTLCALLLEEMLGIKFEPEKTPAWLAEACHEHKLRTYLRLDGWSERARIGFEHQGPHHAKPVIHHGKGSTDARVRDAKNKHETQKRNDVIKRAAVPEGTILVTIEDISESGYAFSQAPRIIETVAAAVVASIPEARRGPTFSEKLAHLRTLDQAAWTQFIQPIFAGSRVYKRLREHVRERRGKLLAIVDERHVRLECEFGHRWTAQINNVLTGNWCPTEGVKKRVASRRLPYITAKARLARFGLRMNWSPAEYRIHYKNNNKSKIPVTRLACGGSFSRPMAKLHEGARCSDCKGKPVCTGCAKSKGFHA